MPVSRSIRSRAFGRTRRFAGGLDRAAAVGPVREVPSLNARQQGLAELQDALLVEQELPRRTNAIALEHICFIHDAKLTKADSLTYTMIVSLRFDHEDIATLLRAGARVMN